MQADIRQVLADVTFLRQTVVRIRFWFDDNTFTDSFPSIGTWRQGHVALDFNGGVDNQKKLDKCLNRYGIQGHLDGNGFYKFHVQGDHDILVILAQALAQRKVYVQARQLSALNHEIEQTVQQLPHVRPSVFSRGVNALKTQVQVLENVRQAHLKEYQK
ncbi:MAG: hypothetical protein K2L95_02370 [Alphaproteobacteria bacterium]|nr:hypothetical protein [Alphaproteobacteria bacterium]